MQTAGIILAAGASSRMGRPKALLQLPDGRPLAVAQSQLLQEAGCDPVVVVLGSDYDVVLPEIAVCRVAYNPDWPKGRVSSVQTGLKAVEAEGYLIMPVDTVGVHVETVRKILTEAERMRPNAVRPTYEGSDGKLVWISKDLAGRILRLVPDESTRLDEILAGEAVRVETNDPNILRNVNTMEDWQDFLRGP